MCGICGIINYSQNNKVEEVLINNMSRQMAHRGPDEAGVYVSNSTYPAAGLGHRRLKIIDLSASAQQPMPNEQRDIWVIFNGEIYNFAQLRQELEAKGHKFRSRSDTEALVHLYEEEGEGCVKKLRGMFAFAIWDERKQTLFLARDRLGKKPLIYSYRDNKFCFASEFTALLASGMVSKETNLDAVNYYLTFGYIPAPQTIYKNVFKLAPAHTLTLKNAEVSIKRYWDLDYSAKIKISQEDAAGEVYRLLKEAVKLRLYSDVPLGAFLSGGIDSSAVVALMSELSPNRVKTFSIGFQEGDYNELHFARNIASRFNTQHQEFIVRPQAMEILPLLIERYGEPYADSSCIPTYYVAQQTRQQVTVALNGDGGD
ncbi:MAG TPA: asparagine synthase (glutamine-hydrolyzing), partial [Candidatus Omnitrophica bacterium]|nr:asparagine synthase (glutamine-hydrolyzing) [Candidatus Omnitrophota bacterium]